MALDANFRMPNPNISDSEKNEDYHKQFVQAIVNRSLNYTYDLNYALMNECYNYYQGIQDQSEWLFLQEAEDGETLPAKWINHQSIKGRIDLMIGELIAKGYDIKVKAINKDAQSRKLKEKERARVDMRMKPITDTLEQQFGLPLSGDRYIPQNPEELDEYYTYNYKETSEIIMESIMRYVAKYMRWDYVRIALFRDLLITGRCFVKNEIIDGIPQSRRIDPRFIIFDTNVETDLLDESTYWGEIRYMNLGDCAEMYNLTTKQLYDVYNSYQEYQKLNTEERITHDDHGHHHDFSQHGTSSLRFFKREGGELRILITTGYWVDSKDIVNKETKDKYDNEHIKRVSDKSTGKNVKRKRVKLWRKGTLIGGKEFVKWGVVENQVRDVDNMATTTAPYFGVVPNFLNARGISKVQQLKSLQDYKNITMYNLQLAMARAGGKGFIYDISQVPEGWDMHTVIKYLKTANIAFIDSMKDGVPAQFNQFQPIDMSLTASVGKYIEIGLMIDREMDRISGINPERRGEVKAASQAVGVTQSALFQSNLVTESTFKLFNLNINRIFNNLAGMVKISWADAPEHFAMIIGDTGVDFLKTDVDLDLNDYGVFIEEIPPSIDNIQNFQAIIQAALQQGKIGMIATMELLMETDVKQGLRKLRKEMKLEEKKLQEMEAQKAKQAQELAQQNIQAQLAMREMEDGSKQEQIESKGKWSMKEALLDNKADLAGKKLDFTKDLLVDAVRRGQEDRKEKATKK